jgi:hypothetical protein
VIGPVKRVASCPGAAHALRRHNALPHRM